MRVIDPPEIVRPEMLTRVTFLPGVRETGAANRTERSVNGGVLVPSGAIWTSGGQDHVWAVTRRNTNRGTLKAVPVNRIFERDGWVRVQGGLQTGTLLAVAEEGLRDGGRVIIGSLRKEATP